MEPEYTKEQEDNDKVIFDVSENQTPDSEFVESLSRSGYKVPMGGSDAIHHLPGIDRKSTRLNSSH